MSCLFFNKKAQNTVVRKINYSSNSTLKAVFAYLVVDIWKLRKQILVQSINMKVRDNLLLPNCSEIFLHCWLRSVHSCLKATVKTFKHIGGPRKLRVIQNPGIMIPMESWEQLEPRYPQSLNPSRYCQFSK